MLADYIAGKTDGSELFALRCQMFRDQMSDEDPNDLLFVPVGYSHQGPILAALAAPAREIFLLCSAESWAVGEQIQKALSQEFTVQILRVIPVDGKDIADKVEAVYESRGCPARVVCDQTGGQKPTSSTLAGLASLNEWRLLYIDALTTDRKIHSESVRWLPNLFDAFGGIHRLVARVCAQSGALQAAEKQIDLSLEHAARSGQLLREKKRIRQARLFRQGQVQAFARSLNRRRWSKEQALIAEEPEALSYWMIQCLWKEGQLLAAEGLSLRTWNSADVQASLKKALEVWPLAIRSLKTLDKEFGRGFQLL